MKSKLSIKELFALRDSANCKNILTQNTKLKYTSKATGFNVFNFSIPAYKSMSGDTICPFAGECRRYCYASKGNYTYPQQQAIMEYKYQLTKHGQLFRVCVNMEIKDKHVSHVRIHDSGDFYSLDYLKVWCQIASDNPLVKFYSYTKSHNMIRLAYRLNLIPGNMTFIFSLGSIQDNLIDVTSERHAKIFDTEYQLLKEGYVNASKIDIMALGDNIKVGLIKH